MVDPGIIGYVKPVSDDNVNDHTITGSTTSGGHGSKSGQMTIPKSPPQERVDKVMENIRKLEAFITDFEQTVPTLAERPGIPSIEKDVASIMTYPPLTWSMLQENEVLKTLQPKLNKDTRKSGRKTQIVSANQNTKIRGSPARQDSDHQAPRASDMSQAPSLFDKMKNRAFGTSASGSVSGIASSSAPVSDSGSSSDGGSGTAPGGASESKPFASARTSGVVEPSSIGRDDTMKSPSEIRDEEEIRQAWDRIRDQRPE